MISSKFEIGQQVRHKLLGVLGVIIDVDPEYSLDNPKLEKVGGTEELRTAPWYHVVMEDEDGSPFHAYVAEIQLFAEMKVEHPEQPSLDELSHSIRQQLQTPRLRH